MLFFQCILHLFTLVRTCIFQLKTCLKKERYHPFNKHLIFRMQRLLETNVRSVKELMSLGKPSAASFVKKIFFLTDAVLPTLKENYTVRYGRLIYSVHEILLIKQGISRQLWTLKDILNMFKTAAPLEEDCIWRNTMVHVWENIVCLEEILPLVKKSLVPFERGATVREHCAFCKSKLPHFFQTILLYIFLWQDWTLERYNARVQGLCFLHIKSIVWLQGTISGNFCMHTSAASPFWFPCNPTKTQGGEDAKTWVPTFFVLCVLLVCFGCVCPKEERNRRGEVANGLPWKSWVISMFCKPQTAVKKSRGEVAERRLW